MLPADFFVLVAYKILLSKPKKKCTAEIYNTKFSIKNGN